MSAPEPTDFDVLAWAIVSGVWTYRPHRASWSRMAGGPFVGIDEALPMMRADYDDAHPKKVTAEDVWERACSATASAAASSAQFPFSQVGSGVKWACQRVADLENERPAKIDAESVALRACARWYDQPTQCGDVLCDIIRDEIERAQRGDS